MQRGLLALVNGKVQGVGFRYFVCRQARGLNLSGWVRNRPDGKVEVLAEGEQSELGSGLLLLGKGLPSVVSKDVNWLGSRTPILLIHLR